MPPNLENAGGCAEPQGEDDVRASLPSFVVTLVETLAWLVDTPSPYGDEGALADALEVRLGARLPFARHGNGLVVGKPTGRPLLLLVGHIDTVPAQGQGPSRLVDGRLHGLGASDMKSGLAVMVHLLEDPGVHEGSHDVVGVFYDREEGPLADNRLGPLLLAEPWLTGAEFAVVAEPTDLAVEVGCNGALNVLCHFDGRPAHAARPWHGENAIHRAAGLLAKLAAWGPRDVDIDGLVYREVMGATLAEGGVSRNVVPGHFQLNVNYRFPPTLTVAEAEERFREFVGDDADRLEVTDKAPAGPVPTGNPHLGRLAALTGTGLHPKQGWTDVARLAEHGVPAANYGPGETAQAHQVGESVPVANLEVAFEVLRRWIPT
jgi:succinyl-diaminopimelate desuccinylase